MHTANTQLCFTYDSVLSIENTAKSVYKGHSSEPENMPFMNSSPLHIG
jgi:hypothetical protein